MEKIASFTVDHDLLTPGIYLSRTDGDVITYDLRFITPNVPPFLPSPVMHTIEHLFATFARNSAYKDRVIYFGPMGCRTGFYFLLRDVDKSEAIQLIIDIVKQITEFFGDIPLVHHFAPDIQHKKSAMQRHRAPERISVGAHVREDHRAFQTPQDVCNF